MGTIVSMSKSLALSKDDNLNFSSLILCKSQLSVLISGLNSSSFKTDTEEGGILVVVFADLFFCFE